MAESRGGVHMMAAVLAIALTAADPWSVKNTALEGGLVAASVLDAMQTRWFLNHTTHEEGNVFDGPHPSAVRFYAVTGAELATHALVAYLLPEPYRTAWQVSWLSVEVASNLLVVAVVGKFRLEF